MSIEEIFNLWYRIAITENEYFSDFNADNRMSQRRIWNDKMFIILLSTTYVL